MESTLSTAHTLVLGTCVIFIFMLATTVFHAMKFPYILRLFFAASTMLLGMLALFPMTPLSLSQFGERGAFVIAMLGVAALALGGFVLFKTVMGDQVRRKE